MTIHPSITFDQHQSVLKAIRANQKQRPPNQTLPLLVGVVIGLLLVIAITNPATKVAGVALAAILVALWFAIRAAFKRRVSAAQHTNFQHMQPVLNGNEMTIDSAGIRGTWVDGKAVYDFSWKAFEDHLDRTDDLLFLYAPCCYIRVPKQELSAEQIHEMLAWYEQSKQR
jgi:membrane protein implicated in regulation of membrane protease activity